VLIWKLDLDILFYIFHLETWFERLECPLSIDANIMAASWRIFPLLREIQNRVSKWIARNWGISKSKNPVSTV
jgi:hypothetical protein